MKLVQLTLSREWPSSIVVATTSWKVEAHYHGDEATEIKTRYFSSRSEALSHATSLLVEAEAEANEEVPVQ